MGLNNRSRMNKPSTVGTNWLWRLQTGELTPALQREILRAAVLYGRTERPWAPAPSNNGEEDTEHAAITQ